MAQLSYTACPNGLTQQCARTSVYVPVDDLSIQAWSGVAANAVPTTILDGFEIYLFPPFLNNTDNHQAYIVFGVRARACPEILSNQAPLGFYMNSTWFPTVEHFFQASKFHPHSPKDVAEILAEPDPLRILAMGRERERPMRPDWDSVRNSVMHLGVTEKFKQNSHIINSLYAAGPVIVEHGSADPYWGVGDNGSGQNILGKILTDIRNMAPPPTGLLVRIKITSSSTFVSGRVGMSVAPDEDVLNPMQVLVRNALTRILVNVCQADRGNVVSSKITANGPSITYALSTSARQHVDMICAQCFIDTVTGLARRSVLEQIMIDGLSIARTCINRDKMKLNDPSRCRGGDELFPTYVTDELDISAARPMLAKDGENLQNIHKLLQMDGSPNIFVQPKLDGVRMVAFMRDGELVMMTRTGRLHLIVQEFRHLIEPILAQIRQITGLTNVALDGEMYVHAFPSGLIDWLANQASGKHPYSGYTIPSQLNKINGALSSYGGKGAAATKNAPTIGLLEYHVFTWFELGGLHGAMDRYDLLKTLIPSDVLGSEHYARNPQTGLLERTGPRILLVPSKRISYGEIEQTIEMIRSLNYEGLMIYRADAPYGSDVRDRRLIKIKPTEKEWFPIVGVAEEKNGSDKADIVYAYGTGSYVASGFFNENMKRFLYYNRHLVIGMWAYIRFQKVTQGAAGGGALRDPKVLYISDIKDGQPIDISRFL